MLANMREVDDDLEDDTVPKIDVKSFNIGSFQPQPNRATTAGVAKTQTTRATGIGSGIGGGIGSGIGGGLRRPTQLK